MKYTVLGIYDAEPEEPYVCVVDVDPEPGTLYVLAKDIYAAAQAKCREANNYTGDDELILIAGAVAGEHEVY